VQRRVIVPLASLFEGGADERHPGVLGALDFRTVRPPIVGCAAAAVIRGDQDVGAAIVWL
jgi:hypothetical protein